jgi:hypothetical protein
LSRISVRKYQSGNQICTIQRNWQHRVHKTKKNRVKHLTKITAWKALSFVKPSVNPSTIFPPNFENRGVSNNFVEHLVHNESDFVFLRLVCPMFSVSLECSFSIAPSVLSNVYLRDNYILVIPILQNEQYFYTAFNPTLHHFNHISYHFNFIVHKMLYTIVTYTSILKVTPLISSNCF